MLRCAAIFRWSPRICVSVMLDRHHWTDFQDPGLSSISVVLPLKAQVIAEARSKSPRPPRRGTWKRCCWKRSGSPAEQAPEEAPNATGQRGKERHSLSLVSSQEVGGDHVFFLFPNSPLRAQTPLLLWRGSDGNSSQVSQLRAKRTHWIHMVVFAFLLFAKLLVTASIFSQMKISKSRDANSRTWWKTTLTGSGTGPADPRTTHQSMEL